MEPKILFVDDEANILDSFRRSLSRRFSLDTALGPLEALLKIRTLGPYAVVVSDLKMPAMTGIQLLAHIRETSPDTVRIMLTGFADVEASIAAVNEGHVFRFLTKPCPTEVMAQAINAALEQHRLVTAERELLRGTLRGSVAVLTEILSLVNPEAFGRGERIKRLVSRLATRLGLADKWRYDLMAMLSQLGCVSIPEELLRKKYAGEELAPEERQIVGMHSSVAANLLANIPRMEEVSEAIAHQEDPFRPASPPPMGARLLKCAQDYDDLELLGKDRRESFVTLRSRSGLYDPAILDALETELFADEDTVPRALAIRAMVPGMVLDEEVRSASGVLLMARGQELTEMALLRLRGFVQSHGVREPIRVLVPKPSKPEAAAGQA